MSPRESEPIRRPNDEKLAVATDHLDWNLLRTFAVIVQAESISRAASILNRTQPAVSSALQRLEEQLGYKLIQRGGARFELTAEGSILFRESIELLSRFRRLRWILADTTSEIAGDINLALASHVESPLLDESLKKFHETYPKTRYHIEVCESAKVAEYVLQATVTAGVCLVYNKHRNLKYQRLFTEHFGLFCGRDHPLFGETALTVKDLRDEKFVSFQTDRIDDALWAVALMRNQNEMTGPIVGVSPSLHEVRRMIISGIGIGPLPIHAVEADVRQGLLWRLPPYSEAPSVSIYFLTNPECNHTRAEVLFLDFMKSQISGAEDKDRVFPK
ncbi:MAG: LysR family transcriptional regulator [Lysobacterales bacterium]|jgi:DNA-binding transcriptional LysR family regulator